MMDDDDDWDLSPEELDALERNAATQLAAQKRVTSLAAPAAQAFSTSSSSVTSESPKNIQQVHADPQIDCPTKRQELGSSWIYTSPSKGAGRLLNIKVFQDQGGRIACEAPYNSHLVAALKTVPGRNWDVNRKVWTYPEAGLGDVVKAITSLSHLKLAVEVAPPLAVNVAVLNSSASACTSLNEDDAEVWCTPPQSIPSIQEPETRDVHNLSPSVSQSRLSQPQSHVGLKHAPKKACYVKLFLHSCGRIAAKCDYDTQVVAALKRIPRVDYLMKERLWMFPFTNLSEAEEILRSSTDRVVTVEPLEPIVKRALEATAALPDLQDRYRLVDEKLKKTLMEFQVEGVRFALQHGGRALIADEMGLGKTLQALAVVSCLEEDWPVLIVVPSSLRVHWANMLVTWLNVSPSDITIVMSQGSSRGGYNIIVIADESHYLKNPQAKRTNVCVPVLQKAKYALLLTGTPALSRPIELFKQLQALQPSVYQKINEYGARYCMGGFFGVWQGSSNHEELHALVKSTVMIRRLKLDVLKQLPKKRREQIFMTLDEKAMKQIRALLNELDSIKRQVQIALQLGKKEEVGEMKIAERSLISKIYTETAEVKIPAVQEFLETMLEGGCKFLVFAHHQVMMDAIQEFLQKKKVKFIRIDGKTHPASRQDLVKTFQEKEDVKVAVLGIRAAGVGLTLTAASTVIFAEMSWTPGDLVQAEDRAHRIGQESAVNIYYLHAHDTIDDFIWDAVQHKLENLGQVLDGQEDNTMQFVSNSKEVESGSQTQEQSTLHDYMKPCTKYSATDRDSTITPASNQSSTTPMTGSNETTNRLDSCSSKRKREYEQAAEVIIDLVDSPERFQPHLALENVHEVDGKFGLN
ncbi:hypothetical protein AXG93_2584s1290 [Marchantia polymorpha subsp. ruderalis]|uniref:SWI/SNF-related matrix-associated actin-dependent regulator of chromatin subfamily A-like protein 1 n=1 Tax=Marchantia polymorpha subsp. ruderalis TaxID=1480154 RepID=A0A176VJD8_MARPO|nr:hypothetical protein AXG93_2584s1290 [Marchantia polymorpha subsp. ruderalis]